MTYRNWHLAALVLIVCSFFGSSQSFAAANRPPIISGSPSASAVVGAPYSFQPTASDADRGQTLRFSIRNKPAWAGFNSGTGRLYGTPRSSNIGVTPNIVISASDGRLSASLPAFSLKVVSSVNRPPTVSGTPSRSAVVGSFYNFKPTAIDPDGDAITWAISGRPSGAGFNSSTGQLTWTPATAGTFGNIVIKATDSRGASTSLPAFTITVAQAASAGAVTLSTPTVTVAQNAGSVALTVRRAGGSSGAASVQYATANGTATAGAEYSQTAGTVTWASGDAADKTIRVPLSNATPFSGTRTFSVNLQNATGGSLGSPFTATISINGSAAAGACARTSSSREFAGIYDSTLLGLYWHNTNNWNGAPNLRLWVNDQNCWGATTTATTDNGAVLAYPSITRGWLHNYPLVTASTPGTYDWTTRSGMGVRVTELAKSKVTWGFEAPTTPGSRWLGLLDIYFHTQPTPSENAFYPQLDLMIFQSLMDLPFNSQTGNTYWKWVAQSDNASKVTIGGKSYAVIVDDSSFVYNQPGGHTIILLMLPTSFTDSVTHTHWGAMSPTTHDLKGIIDYFRQASPRNDAGQVIKFANGSSVTTPLIASNLYLTAINAGWEISAGTSFKTTKFCVSMQNEPDCN